MGEWMDGIINSCICRVVGFVFVLFFTFKFYLLESYKISSIPFLRLLLKYLMIVLFLWLSLLRIKNQKYWYKSLHISLGSTIPEVGFVVHWAKASTLTAWFALLYLLNFYSPSNLYPPLFLQPWCVYSPGPTRKATASPLSSPTASLSMMSQDLVSPSPTPVAYLSSSPFFLPLDLLINIKISTLSTVTILFNLPLLVLPCLPKSNFCPDLHP